MFEIVQSLRLLMIVCLSSAFVDGWSYRDTFMDGPSSWGSISPLCAGRSQSPINFEDDEPCVNQKASKIIISNADKKPRTIIFGNNGNGITVAFNFTGDCPTITGGPVGERMFKFSRYNMHWPSEHTVNQKHFDAELQLVFHDPKYHPFEAAANPDGLVIFSFFMKVDPYQPLDFDKVRPFLFNLQHIYNVGESYNETHEVVTLNEVIQSTKFSVWSYKGSLTTPDCDETVTWLVSKTPLNMHISELQLLSFIKDHHGEVIQSNNRPIQKLNNRTIQCFP